MIKPVCWQCISDPVLKDWVRNNGKGALCAYCARRRVAMPVAEVAERIDAVIRHFYRPGQMAAHVVDDSDNLKYWEEGSPVSEIIQEIAGIDEDATDDVIQLLHREEWRDIKDGADAYYSDTPLEHLPADPGEFLHLWEYFEERLKHQVRFFDDVGKKMLDTLFGDLPSLAEGKAVVSLTRGDAISCCTSS